METRQPLVTSAWLLKHLGDSNLIILDASVDKVVGKEAIEYQSWTCIPGSLKFDLDKDFHDQSSPLPHTFPPISQFNQRARKLGINNHSTVVVYDNQGIYSSPRAWWMLTAMGLNNVYVLDGGLPLWLEGENPVDTHYGIAKTGNFEAKPRENCVCGADGVLSNLDNIEAQIIDVRAAGRFSGQAPEPRVGLRSGHIPNSVNLPFAKVLSENGLTYLPNSQLTQVMSEAEINFNASPNIFSCGSGMTACIVLLAAYHLGLNNLCLYDGSWTEWGARQDLPISQ